MLTSEKLEGQFGIRVFDADLSRSPSDSELRELAALLFGNGILAIVGQTLSNDDYVRFGRRWGEPVLLIKKNNRLGTHPEMIVQSNATKVPPYVRNVAAHWHQDSAYEEVAATVTMLYGVAAPEDGGETLFADLVAAYRDLPHEMKSRIDGLQVRHRPGGGKGLRFDNEIMVDRASLPAHEQADIVELPPAVHPLVRVHPATGQPALYGLSGTPYEVVGMADADGMALLSELKQHALSARYLQSYKLLPGEVLMWDNFAVMHRATPIEYSDEPRKRRLNFRISTKGLPDFLEQPAALEPEALPD